jgi:L-cysteine/cystine lyase
LTKDWGQVRARFPVLEHHAYLNAGTFGPLARTTAKVSSRLRDWELEHGRGGRAYFDEMLATRVRVRDLLAGQIGAPAANVALTQSTTQGVHVVVIGLGLGPDDAVVTTDAEHFGLTGPLLASGARLQIAKVRDARADDVFELVRAQITPQSRLIAISAVSWIDGTIFPWRELQEASGLPVLIDGAQSVGAIAVDATAADFYTVSAQKWLCGPDATGALYVRNPGALQPRLVAYPSAEAYDIAAGTWEPKAGAPRFDPIFAPASSLVGLEAALNDLPAGRFERARELTERCRTLLADAGREVVTQPGQATLVTFRAHGDAAAASAALYRRGVVIRDLPGGGLLRASVGWWNDETDLERLVESLDEVDG